MDAADTSAPVEQALPRSDPPARPKQAVIVIHGMGSQSPMATLRSFVEAVWTSVQPPLAKDGVAKAWTKRDDLLGSFELRRITTNENINGRRTDFFEFYWAHMMEGTQLSTVLWWLKRLLVRRLRQVPQNVRPPWFLGWIALAGGLLLLAAIKIAGDVFFPHSGLLYYVVVAALLGLVVWFIRHRVLVEVVGDAARYLTPSPENIAARSRIREAGLELLAQLHKGHTYDRIVIACHSLGTVVGYDILSFYWSNVSAGIHHAPGGGSAAARKLADAAGALKDNPDDPALLANYRGAQRAYFTEVRQLSGGTWKISDFVTIGSPLTHAHFLLVNDLEPLLPSDHQSIEEAGIPRLHKKLDADPAAKRVARLFSARAAQREFPLCPPLPDTNETFVYQPPGKGYSIPHHAAVFAPVCWTNIYAPRRLVLWGDVVGGPVAPLFGPGVQDVPLQGEAAGKWIAHVHYWDLGLRDNAHIEALRDALALDEA